MSWPRTGLNIDEELTYWTGPTGPRPPPGIWPTMGALAGDLAPGDLRRPGQAAAGILCRLMEHIGLLWD